eukprot:5808510-Prymnesium_polylepis.1
MSRVSTSVPECHRGPEAFAIWVVDRVGLAKEPDALPGTDLDPTCAPNPGLQVLSKLVPLGVLDRDALEELFLFCRRELRK